jgi:hypothetical protein
MCNARKIFFLLGSAGERSARGALLSRECIDPNVLENSARFFYFQAAFSGSDIGLDNRAPRFVDRGRKFSRKNTK